jgi:hypothetical protein
MNINFRETGFEVGMKLSLNMTRNGTHSEVSRLQVGWAKLWKNAAVVQHNTEYQKSALFKE